MILLCEGKINENKALDEIKMGQKHIWDRHKNMTDIQ